MPFISEEIYQRIRNENDPESITIAPQPKATVYSTSIIDQFNVAKQAIMAIRNVRQEKNIPHKEALRLFVKKNNNESPDTTFDGIVKKLCNLEELQYIEEKPVKAFSIILNTTELYIPLEESIDVESEIIGLETDLNYQKGFLLSIEKKLSNEKFVNHAPSNVVDMERKKQADALARIKVIEEQLKGLRAT